MSNTPFNSEKAPEPNNSIPSPEILKAQIEQIYLDIQQGKKPEDLTSNEIQTIQTSIAGLDQGTLRVATPLSPGQWQINEWLKMAILLFFRVQNMSLMQAGDFQYWDKIPVKKWTGREGVRAVPHALARKGSHVAPGAILMPSYINIGAYVDSGTMVDTWATVGSCAQVGKNVHLSGGVGLGGVLEPIQASPVIIEDHAFIGSRCIVVEGTIVEEGAVLGAGVTITSSTKIIDVTGPEPRYLSGRVPAYSVVIPGSYSKNFAAGAFGVPCALIIGKRKASTDNKTSLTEALREFQVPV